jgi:eukaryotic-like serine/threonine-protein kinase
MTKTERTCTRCGLVFASDKLAGLCPSCLLNSLFQDEDRGETQAFWDDDGSGQSDDDTSTVTPIRRFSHFELLEELGRGGMGIVYRARDVGSGRIVALKVLQAHHLEVPDLVLRFRSEVRAVTSLDHPHVLPVHEVGEYEGIPFFSMKLTTGGSLAQRLGDFLGKPTEIARLMAKVTRGVAHAHERGILHRDLKPANILLDAAGEPYVCDFGLAKWLEDDRNLTITSAVLGTPHYIAPEQASGQKGLTTAADIYSLGSIIYELLTARPPFVGQSIIETLRLASENTPERPSSLVQNIPQDLETICLKCLQREPASRYPSAAALANDLENWLAGRPILARPVSAGEQLWRWAKRNPLPAALIASIAMLLAATAVVATVSAIRIEKARDRAVAAEKDAVRAEKETQEQLYASLLAQARAARLTGRAGQRFTALDALEKAAKIHQSIEVRNEAAAALALTDIRLPPEKTWKIGTSNRPPRAFDASLEHIADEIAPGTIRILRLSDQKEVARLSEPDSPRIEFITRSEGNLLAVRHAGGLIKVWDVAKQKKLYELAGHPTGAKASWYAFDCCFSPDGSILALGNPEGGAVLYNAVNGLMLRRVPAPFIPSCLTFSPDGTRLALGSFREMDVLIWDLTSGHLLKKINTPGAPYHMAWSADGSRLAVGSSDMNAYVFSSDGLLLGACKGHRQEVTQVLFHPEGSRLISTGRDVTIRLWSLTASTQSGKSGEPALFAQEVYLTGYGGEPNLRLSQQGTQLALTVGETAAIGVLESGERICRTLVNGKPPGRATMAGSVAFSADGRRAATASYEYIDVWDVGTGRLVGSFDLDPDEEKSVRFGKDADTLIVGSRKSGLREYAIVSANEQASLKLRSVLSDEEGFIFTNSPPGDAELIPMTDHKRGVARIFDLAAGKTIFQVENLPYVWDMAISPDRQHVVLGFSSLAPINEGDLEVWSVSKKERMQILPNSRNSMARFSADGKWLKSGAFNYLISTADWSVNRKFDYEGNNPSFSRDFTWVASRYAEKIIVSDAATGRAWFNLESPLLPGSIFRLSVSPDDTLLAAHSTDNTLLIWNLKLLREELRNIGLRW